MEAISLMKLKRFTIIEKKWARGGKNGISGLQNNRGNRCCLGFLCSAAGFRRLTDLAMPDDLLSLIEPYPKQKVLTRLLGLVSKKSLSTTLCICIARINDDRGITDDQRKAKLDTLFRKIGWKPIYR